MKGRLSKEFQRKIYETYKADHDDYYANGAYHYSIAHNATASIHTWIIRRKGNHEWHGDWHWLQPLDEEIK